MKIAELFESIQGEGTLIGVPSTFIRTSGCNMRCRWCDTPYTSWEPGGEEKSVSEIVAFVRGSRNRHVVITGGEPMIAADIVELTEAVRDEDRHITIETAGTVAAQVACDLMSVSPKLSNSTPDSVAAGGWSERHERLRIQLDVLRKLTGSYEYQLKFVIAAPGDLDEVRQLVASLGSAPDRVILMPEGRSRQGILARSGWIVEACRAEGWRFSPRLQIDLWGNQRGV